MGQRRSPVKAPALPTSSPVQDALYTDATSRRGCPQRASAAVLSGRPLYDFQSEPARPPEQHHRRSCPLHTRSSLTDLLPLWSCSALLLASATEERAASTSRVLAHCPTAPGQTEMNNSESASQTTGYVHSRRPGRELGSQQPLDNIYPSAKTNRALLPKRALYITEVAWPGNDASSFRCELFEEFIIVH